MHLKDIIKAVLIIGALIAIAVFALSKLDGAANDSMNPALDARSSAIDDINNI